MDDTNDTIYGIYGAGGPGLSTLFFIKNNPFYECLINHIFFIDDNKKLIKKKTIMGENLFISADTIVNKDVLKNSRLIGSQRIMNVT